MIKIEQGYEKKIMPERSLQVRRVVMCGLCMALILVVTRFSAIPLPFVSGAYINLGDSFVFGAAWLLGGLWGGLAAGMGSALADLLLGAALYAPATLIIKFVMALLAGLLFEKTKGKVFLELLVMFVGGLVMTAGYFIYECFLAGVGAAAPSLLFNLIQAAAGALAGLLLVRVAKRFPQLKA